MTTRRATLKIIAGSAGLALAPGRARAATYEPKYFSKAEMHLLAALSETIIPADEHSPGAIAAAVPEYIDTIVSAGGEALKKNWSAGLAALDAASRTLHGRAFAACTAEQRIAVLQPFATQEEHPASVEEKFFVTLKRATIDGYYTSAVGIHQDLQYQGNQMNHDFRDCANAEHRQS